MSELIKVLLVDDFRLTRKGWKEALSGTSDITIIGELSTAEMEIQSFHADLPDVVLLDLQTLKEDKSVEIIKIIREQIPRIKVILIVYDFEGINKSKVLGAEEAILAPIQRQRLIHLIRGLFRDDKRLCENYLEQLYSIKPGIKGAVRYEKLMTEILQMLFSQHLSHARFQIPTEHGTERRDMILFNGSDHPFWRTIRERYEADQVVFEFKNSKGISLSYLNQIQGYLGQATGRFGILTSRQAARKNVRLKQITIFNTQNKIVLIICDDDIHNMLAYKAAGIDPTDALVNLYTDLKNSVQ